MFGRFTTLIGAVSVGYDQSSIGREKIAGQFSWKSKKQPVAMCPVDLPFSVRAQILPRGLDFNDPDIALRVHRHQIGSATRRQRQFLNAKKTERGEETRRTPRHQTRSFGLATIDERHHSIERGLGHFAIIKAGIAAAQREHRRHHHITFHREAPASTASRSLVCPTNLRDAKAVRSNRACRGFLISQAASSPGARCNAKFKHSGRHFARDRERLLNSLRNYHTEERLTRRNLPAYCEQFYENDHVNFKMGTDFFSCIYYSRIAGLYWSISCER